MDSLKTSSTGDITALVGRLSNGWRHSNAEAVGLAQRIAGGLDSEATGIKYLDNAVRFDLDLPEIRLAGMDDVKCIILGGDGSDVGELVSEYWKSAGAAGRIGLVFCTNETVYAQVRKSIPRGRAVVLAFQHILDFLGSSIPRRFLIERLRHTIPLRRLIPFRSQGPVWNCMFRGRSNELDRLKHEEAVNFAIAGPSRIGKSSLVKRYREYELRKDRDPRMNSCYYIDLYEYSHLDDDGVAQLIALRLDNSLKNSRMTMARLSNLLRFLTEHFGRPVELIFDEVDALIRKSVFQNLGQAARNGYCRLILVGRGELAQMTLNQSSPFACRMEWLKLEGLSDEQSRDLFFGPLTDLGYGCPSPDRVYEMIRASTGRLPHLIQYYGYQVAERLINPNSHLKVIDEHAVATVRDHEQTVAYVMSPLDELPAKSRQIAIELLRQPPTRITLPKVQQAAENVKVSLRDEEVLPLCTELVIANILAWEGRAYRLASEALTDYAQDLGLFDEPRQPAVGGARPQ